MSYAVAVKVVSVRFEIAHVLLVILWMYQLLWYFYRPQRSWGEVSTSVHAGIPPPKKEAPPGRRHPPGPCTPGTMHPPGPCTPREGGTNTPRDHAPPGIRSMSGRYASYWNAFLFTKLCFLESAYSLNSRGGGLPEHFGKSADVYQ